MIDVGLRLGRVLADHEQPSELAARHGLEHLGEVPAVLGRDRGAPRGLELGPGHRVLDVLEAGQLGREGAHVAAALHVVLPAQRVEPGAPPADVPAEQRQVDEGEHVVDTVVVLGDAERPADLRPVGAGVGMGELADRLDGNSGDLRAALERPLLDRCRVLGEAGRAALDEDRVDEPGVDDLAGDRVRQRDVGADLEAEPDIRELRRRAAARVDDVELGAVAHTLQHVVEEDRMRVARVRAPHHDDIGVLDLRVRRGATASSEHCGQTDHAGSVSSAVAGVDVVGAGCDASQLLDDEVHLVGRLRAREEPDRLAAVRVANGSEAIGGTPQRFVPAGRPQFPVVADEGLREPAVRHVTMSTWHAQTVLAGPARVRSTFRTAERTRIVEQSRCATLALGRSRETSWTTTRGR